MSSTYVTPAGDLRVTCGSHRTLGYYVAGQTPEGTAVWACRDCGVVPEHHETTDETVARRAAEAAAAA